MNVGEKPFNTLVNLNVNNPLEKTSLNIHTLGFLPKIPFKMTQSIHVALQKNCYFD